jgi:hypothetical protein
MMIFSDLLGALFASLLVAIIFWNVFKVIGPWESFFIFFAIIFLFTWAMNVWVPSYGLLVWGYPIVTGLFMALLVALLLAAVGPPRKVNKPLDMDKDTETDIEPIPPTAGIALGIFFWLFIFLTLVAIVASYFV